MSRSVLALGVLAALLAAAGLMTRQTSVSVSGQVRGEHGPLKGARVRLQARPEATTTGRDGRFRLPCAGGRVTAWAPGHLIAGTKLSSEPLVVQLRPIPDEDDPEYAWVDPDGQGEHACGRCHTEVRNEWAAGGHARSATGRRFRNLYDGLDWTNKRQASWGLLAQHPDGAGVCTACHAPSVAAGDPADFDLRQVAGVAARGRPLRLLPQGRGPGDGEPRPDARPRSAAAAAARARASSSSARSTTSTAARTPIRPLYSDSRYCAACHEGVVFGVPVYTTYSEWLRQPGRPPRAVMPGLPHEADRRA